MTLTAEDLARRAVACKGWRWMPGMLTLPFRESGPDSPVCHPAWRVIYDGRSGPYANPKNNDAPPDLTDPATLGCLLALVREAWGDPRLVAICCEAAHPGQSEGWAVQAADGRLPVAGEDYPSEVAALVAALEAAP
jgi:hypothetical protein